MWRTERQTAGVACAERQDTSQLYLSQLRMFRNDQREAIGYPSSGLTRQAKSGQGQ